MWVRRGVILLGCLLLLDGLFGERGLAQSQQAKADLHRAAEELGSLQRDPALLRDQASRLRSDPATVEAAARRELGLIRRGEVLILLTDVK
jgi:cell division protein FtsB